jgi:hypothetical protein
VHRKNWGFFTSSEPKTNIDNVYMYIDNVYMYIDNVYMYIDNVYMYIDNVYMYIDNVYMYSLFGDSENRENNS